MSQQWYQTYDSIRSNAYFPPAGKTSSKKPMPYLLYLIPIFPNFIDFAFHFFPSLVSFAWTFISALPSSSVFSVIYLFMYHFSLEIQVCWWSVEILYGLHGILFSKMTFLLRFDDFLEVSAENSHQTDYFWRMIWNQL